jgi:DNA (cytosine-5)-methyltransferase 1
MRFIELFAGIGGFRLGLEKAGMTCVYANEIDPRARSIYAANFHEEPDGRDIRTVGAVPGADLACGGFPCQAFSAAGNREGFGDPRGTLFYEFARVASGARCRLILLENVRGMLYNDAGRTFAAMLVHLDELGYDCQWQLLDSRAFGVPQFRERVFLVGHLRGTRRPRVFPVTAADTADLRSRCAQQHRQGRAQAEIFVMSHTQGNMTNRHRMSSYAWTLDAAPQHKMAFARPGQPLRRMTPVEACRLQGLPDGFTARYADGVAVPERERYKRIGMSVTVPVIELIGQRLMESL